MYTCDDRAIDVTLAKNDHVSYDSALGFIHDRGVTPFSVSQSFLDGEAGPFIIFGIVTGARALAAMYVGDMPAKVAGDVFQCKTRHRYGQSVELTSCRFTGSSVTAIARKISAEAIAADDFSRNIGRAHPLALRHDREFSVRTYHTALTRQSIQRPPLLDAG